MDYLESVRDFIVTNFLFGDGDQLAEETSFVEKGIIDSTGILELVIFIEETCGFKIEDNDLIPENLDNLVNIAAFINRKLNCNVSA